MQVIQDLKSGLVPLLCSLNRLCFTSFCLFRVGQVTFSGRLLCQMRLQTLFVVCFADRAAGRQPPPGIVPEYQKPMLPEGYERSFHFGARLEPATFVTGRNIDSFTRLL